MLLFDAATCLLMGVALIALAEVMAAWFGLPTALLRWASVLLLPCAALTLCRADVGRRTLHTDAACTGATDRGRQFLLGSR